MPWGKVDDRHYDHPKVQQLPVAIRNEAEGLYWRAISYSNAKLTDGFIADPVVELLDGHPELTEALVAAKLWHRRRSGFEIHDFGEFNKLRAQVESEREKRAEAGRLGGQRSGESRRNDPRGGPRKAKLKQRASSGFESASNLTNSRPNPNPNPDPSEDSPPDPPPSGGQAKASPKRANGANPRSLGTNPRAIADREYSATTERRRQRRLAELDGRLTTVQRELMDQMDAPLEEIPAERGAAYAGVEAPPEFRQLGELLVARPEREKEVAR